MELSNKTALITGAAGGIGSALANELNKRGTRLILIDYNQDKLRSLEKDLGEKHEYYAVDFTNKTQLLDTLETILKTTKTLDILINNAGIGVYENLERIDPKDWDISFDVNIHAPFTITKLLLPLLKAAEKGHIINVGSICGSEVFEPRLAYNTTKFALRGFSLSLSKEFEDTNLSATYITLGHVLTDFGPKSIEERLQMQEAGEITYFTPQEVAENIVNLIETDQLIPEVEIRNK